MRGSREIIAATTLGCPVYLLLAGIFVVVQAWRSGNLSVQAVERSGATRFGGTLETLRMLLVSCGRGDFKVGRFSFTVVTEVK